MLSFAVDVLVELVASPFDVSVPHESRFIARDSTFNILGRRRNYLLAAFRIRWQ
jgi:hypothetical protein